MNISSSKKIVFALTVSFSILLSGVSQARDDDDNEISPFTANVRSFGAKGEGRTDDTNAFRRAIASIANGGVLRIPAGKYVVSGTLQISKPITINGDGFSSQIVETSDAPLFSLRNVNAATIRDLYLGSSGTSSASSLIELINSNHNRIDNITMLGGYFGILIRGSLLNTFVDIRSGTNFQGFFAPTSTNQYWIYAVREGNISSNANTFIAPVLEGGANGIYIQDPPKSGQASITVIGGTIEGVSNIGLVFENTFLPSSVIGTHFEQNGAADVVINNSSNIQLNGILSLREILITGDSRNISVKDSIVQHATFGPATKRIRYENITSGITCGPSVTNNNTGFDQDGKPNVIISQLGNYCGNQ